MLASKMENKTFDEKYCFGNNFGETIFWNITDMRKYINENNVPIRHYSVEELFEENPSPVNKEYALGLKQSKLGIIVELTNGDRNLLKLIDGNHQLYKEKLSGNKTFGCYYFSYEEQIKFVVDIDGKPIPAEVYNKFIRRTIQS
jgi:hypothetical protein